MEDILYNSGRTLTLFVTLFVTIGVTLSSVVPVDVQISSPADFNNIPTDAGNVRLTFTPTHTVTFTPGLFPSRPNLVSMDMEVRYLTSIGQRAFENLVNLDQLVLEKPSYATAMLETIQAQAFQGLNKLHTLTLRDLDLKTVEAGVFTGLPDLAVLTLHNNKLQTLPSPLCPDSSKMYFLDISKNQLTSLTATFFSGITDLAQLDISSNDIQTLGRGLFKDLTTLNSLNLGYNKLTAVNSGILEGLGAVQFVQLEHNDITSIGQSDLTTLVNLREINLGNNQLSSIHSQAFSSLIELRQIGLNNNSLEDLNLDGSLQNLNMLDLSHNPWRCECNLHPLLDLIESKISTYPSFLLNGALTKCNEPPSLANKLLTQVIQDDDLSACIFTSTMKSTRDLKITTIETTETYNTAAQTHEVNTGENKPGPPVGMLIAVIAGAVGGLLVIIAIAAVFIYRAKCTKWDPKEELPEKEATNHVYDNHSISSRGGSYRNLRKDKHAKAAAIWDIEKGDQLSVPASNGAPPIIIDTNGYDNPSYVHDKNAKNSFGRSNNINFQFSGNRVNPDQIATSIPVSTVSDGRINSDQYYENNLDPVSMTNSLSDADRMHQQDQMGQMTGGVYSGSSEELNSSPTKFGYKVYPPYTEEQAAAMEQQETSLVTGSNNQLQNMGYHRDVTDSPHHILHEQQNPQVDDYSHSNGYHGSMDNVNNNNDYSHSKTRHLQTDVKVYEDTRQEIQPSIHV